MTDPPSDPVPDADAAAELAPPPAPIRSLEAAMAWLGEQTNYERQTDWSYARLGFHLDAYRDFLATIGEPQRRLPPTVHVAGTKGKGSACLMLEALCRSAGLRTGVFLSPHLESVTERIRIDGQPVADEQFAALLDGLRTDLDGFRRSVRPITFFEIVTTMAIRAFIEADVDVAILEVGLGGRLDATNVVDADVAVITQIGLDHTDKLGETLPEIGREKAGILKAGREAVIGPMPDEPTDVAIRELAATLEPPPRLYTVDRGMAVREADRLTLTVDGESWTVPAPDRPVELDAVLACAVLAARRLADLHGLAIDWPRAVSAAAGAPLPGRAERMQAPDGIRVIVDGAHNPDSLRAIAGYWRANGWQPVLLLGMNRDKLTPGCLGELGHASATVTCTIPGPRAATASELAAAWKRTHGSCVEEVDDPVAALSRACDLARGSGVGVVVATGSVYLAGTVRPLLQRHDD